MRLLFTCTWPKSQAKHPPISQIILIKNQNPKLLNFWIPQITNTFLFLLQETQRDWERKEEMAMARASSGLQYPDRFYAAASYAGFDGSPRSSSKAVRSKFNAESALILYALYQQVPTSTRSHSAHLILRFSFWSKHRSQSQFIVSRSHFPLKCQFRGKNGL